MTADVAGSLAILVALPAGIVLHELAHAVPSYLMGTLAEVGVLKNGRWPGGAYVAHTRQNRLATFAPIVWLVPFFYVTVTTEATTPLAVFVAASTGFAAAAWFLSDLQMLAFDETVGDSETELIPLLVFQEVDWR